MDSCGPTTPAVKQCQAPDYGGYSLGIPEATNAGSSAASAPPTAGAPTPSTGTTDKGSSGAAPSPGAAGSSDSQGAGGAGSDDNAAASSTKGSSSSDNGGCQVGAGHADAAGASLLALLGVAGLMRRKRTRWG